MERESAAMEATSERAERLAILLTLSHEPMFAWRLDGSIEFWNAGAERLYGFAPPAHIVRRSSDRTLEQIADPVLEDPVGRQADRIFDPLGFQELVDLRHGERCVSAEIDTRELALVACNDGLEHAVPAVGAVHVAGTQGAAFEITELVEHEQRMIAGAGVMAVPDARLQLPMGRAHARIHVEHDASRPAATVHKVDPLAGQIGNSREVLGCREPLRLEAAHLAR